MHTTSATTTSRSPIIDRRRLGAPHYRKEGSTEDVGLNEPSPRSTRDGSGGKMGT